MHKQVKQNPASKVYPVQYGAQRQIQKQKMAVFDIDDTLYDCSIRETNARRAGLVTSTPFTGDRKSSDYPKGKKAFMEFFNSPKQFRADPITPGAVEYVNGLSRDGYVIAYLTGRPERYMNQTIEHLKESGFPVYEKDNEPLVFMKPNKKNKTPVFKYKVMRDLQQFYDIHYFYDDLKDNREKAFQLGVIGVYDLRDRLGVKTNPNHAPLNCGCGKTPCVTYGPQPNPYKITSQIDGGHPQGKPGTVFHLTNVPEGYREAAGCLVRRKSDGKILFLRRSKKETSKHGLYEFPGGKLEGDESPMEAALVETQEEAGLEVDIIRQLSSHVDHTMKKVYHCFLAEPKKGAKVKLSEEHDMYKWFSLGKKWPKSKLSHHARFMLNQLSSVSNNGSTGEYHKYVAKVHKILEVEGGAAGLSALKPAFPKKTTKKKAISMLAQMPGVVQHADGDYILVTGLSNPGHKTMSCEECDKLISEEEHRMYMGACRECMSKSWNKGPVYDYDSPLPNPLPKPKKKNGRKEPAKAYVKRMMGNTKMRAEFPDRSQRYAVTINLVEKHYGKRGLKSIGAKPNPKTKVLPIMSGEPSGKHTKLGAIFAEVVIGRNIVKDVGEVVQGIYRGLIGGRTSMAEKRLAMGVASMQKELSDRAQELGGNAVCNLKLDYEMIQGSQTITIIAMADAIKMARPPTRKNPRMPLDGMEEDKKVKKAKKAYKRFHGGKEPVDITKKTIDVGDVWYSLGPCWSIGYMSPKETGDESQKYIHHVNEDSQDGNFPMMYYSMPEKGKGMIVIPLEGSSMKVGIRDNMGWLID